MKTRSIAICLTATLLAACGGGGGGDDNDDVARVDPPVKPSPTPAPTPTPTPPPTAAPTPIAAPVPSKPAPEEPPVTEPPPPVSGPTPAPPEPEPGTYVTGKLLRAALNQYPAESPKPAYLDGDTSKQQVRINYYDGGTYWYHYTWPLTTPSYTPDSAYAKFPQQSVDFPVDYGTDGVYGLGRQITSYTYNGKGSANAVLIRDERFKVVEEGKYLLNTSIATWYGVEGTPWFVQLQVATLEGAPAVFKLCLHTLIPNVRRLSCTLHDKDTGQYRGIHIIDDSDGLGPVQYLPAK